MLFIVYSIFGRSIPRVSRFDSTYYSGVSDADSALDILKTRYAKGEITKVEYDSMRKNLL